MAKNMDQLHQRQGSWWAGYALSVALVGMAVIFTSSPTERTTLAQDLPAANAEEPPRYVVHLTFIEIDEHGHERSTNRKFTGFDGTDMEFLAGGEVPYFDSDGVVRYVEFGHRIRLTVSRCKDGSIFVDGEFEKSAVRSDFRRSPPKLRLAKSSVQVFERVTEGELITLNVESPVRRKPWVNTHLTGKPLEVGDGQPRKNPPSGMEVWRVEFTVNTLDAGKDV